MDSNKKTNNSGRFGTSKTR